MRDYIFSGTTSSGGGGGGGVAAPPVQSLIDTAVSIGKDEAFSGGPYSLGLSMYAIESVSLKGGRFRKPNAGTVSIKLTLYASDKTTILATKTVSCSQGTTSIAFTSPFILEPTQGLVYLQYREMSGSYYYGAQQGASHLTPFLPPQPVQVGKLIHSDRTLYAEGDQCINSTGGHYGLLEPEYT